MVHGHCMLHYRWPPCPERGEQIVIGPFNELSSASLWSQPWSKPKSYLQVWSAWPLYVACPLLPLSPRLALDLSPLPLLPPLTPLARESPSFPFHPTADICRQHGLETWRLSTTTTVVRDAASLQAPVLGETRSVSWRREHRSNGLNHLHQRETHEVWWNQSGASRGT